MQPEAAQTLALQALGWIAADDEVFPVFLTASGATLGELRARAADPDFLAVYPYVTTVTGNRFRCRGGDPEEVTQRLASLFRKRLGPDIRASRV